MAHLCATRLIHPYSEKKTQVKIAQRFSSVNEDEEKGGGGTFQKHFFSFLSTQLHACQHWFFLCMTFFCWHRIWVQKSPPCYQKEEKRMPLRHCASYAACLSSKETYSLWKEAYCAEVSHELICVTCLFGIMCVAVCCSVLQCVAVCCSVLHCVTVCGSVCYCECCGMLQCVAVSVDSCEVSPSYHVRCSVLQRVAACCSVLQRPLPLRQHTHARRTRHIRPVGVCVCVRARAR